MMTTVTEPITASTTAISARIAAMRRVRRVRPRQREPMALLIGGFENIAGPSQGMDHRWSTHVDLLAQVRDVELDDVGLSAEVVVPHAVENLRLAEHPSGVAHEETQQLELGRGQRHRLAGPADLVAVLIHGE